MKTFRTTLTIMTGTFLLAGMSMAQNNTKSTMNGGVTTADQHFMDKAAQGGMAEVELGQLAEQNAQSSEVKAFGKRMVDDHSKANDQLKQLASQEEVSLPTSLDAKDQATKDRLEKLHGAAFDKAYMHDMVMDHKKDVAEFKHESEVAHSPALRDWAKQTTPTLESHLQEAEKVAPQVGASMPSSATMGKNNGMSTTGESH